MLLDTNDPRLIDYALGECGPDEAREIQAALDEPQNAPARDAVREYRQLAGLAREALAEEPRAELSAAQRDAVMREAKAARPRRVPWRFAAPLLAAAVLLLVAGVALLVPNTAGRTGLARLLPFERAREAARRSTPESERLMRKEEQLAQQQSAGPAGYDIPAEVREQMEALGYLADEQSAAQPVPATETAAEMPAPASAVAMPAPPPPVPAATPASAGPARLNRPRSADGAAGNEAKKAELDALGYAAGGAAPAADLRAGAATAAGVRAEHYFAPEPMPMPEPPPQPEPWQYRQRNVAHWGDTESYLPIVENAFAQAAQAPLSTFSIDVDTGAYSNVRRFLEQGQLPPRDAVRLEEMINYFAYDLPQPEGPEPFSAAIEMADCPWAPGHKLARVALQGKTIAAEARPAGNFVFLIDVSGSMDQPNKLPLVRESMKALLGVLEPRDRVAIVTYASGSAIVLPSTPVSERVAIRRAIDSLSAGGSTHGSAGIEDAYRVAREHFIGGGINRVVLATDGDFNVGVTSHDALMQLIADQAKSKVFLTALGFGYGNLKDSTLEQLADKGNGNYAYIDDFAEARKVLVEQMTGTMIAIAKDVKIQVEFNPAQVQAYRLLGYENRALAAKDFNDDTKDAGEIGAGHQVTALYQIVPNGASIEPGVDPLKYAAPQPAPAGPAAPASPEWMTVKLRWKAPEGDVSSKIEAPWSNPGGDLMQASADFRFASSVAAFGMLLRDSQYKGRAHFDGVIALAESALEDKPERREFVDLVVTAKTIKGE